MKNLIEETNKATQEIESIYEAEKASVKTLEREKYKLASELRDKIHALESEKYKIEREYEKKIETLKDENRAKVFPLMGVKQKYDRVIELIEISKATEKDLSLSANNRGRELQCIDEPVNNEYIHIYVYVYQNDKPKNKFTLAFAARSIFSTEMMGYRWGSIKPYFEGNRASFEFDIKDAPTKKELIDFYTKKGADSFWKKDDFENLVKEYETVLKECNTNEWQKECLLSKKYYYENNYSGGTKTPEYKQILKELGEMYEPVK